MRKTPEKLLHVQQMKRDDRNAVLSFTEITKCSSGEFGPRGHRDSSQLEEIDQRQVEGMRVAMLPALDSFHALCAGIAGWR